MAPFRQIFWPPRSGDRSPRSRWHRLRRTDPTAPTDSPVEQPEPETGSQTQKVADQTQTVSTEAADNVTTAADDEIVIEHDDGSSENDGLVPALSETAGRSNASTLSRTYQGSNLLKSIIARLRHSRSHGQSEDLELTHPLQPPETKDVGTITDPIKNEPREPLSPLARNPPTGEGEAAEQKRNVSAQTAESHDSKNTSATVHRCSSQHLQTPILELQQSCFSPAFSEGYPPDPRHLPEASDPFSDKKNVEVTTTPVAKAPSKRSSRSSKKSSQHSERGKRNSELSNEQDDEIRPAPLALPKQQTLETSRHGSNASYSSRTSRIGQLNAAQEFNVLADKMKVPFLLNEDAVKIETQETAMAIANKANREPIQTRDKLFRRVRPVQSNMEIEVPSQSSASKLRRTKTFANLTRRSNPLSSLRGRSLESMSRLGGHSYLVWGSRLIPGPLQLPACIVAMICYLRKYGPNTTGLFKEPGDLRACHRLYDYFANQVLEGEKEESKVSMTIRTISMPHWEGESTLEQKLSVGVTFRALLMGLPEGLLGSARLYEALEAIHICSIVVPLQSGPRVQLITLAMIATTSEMERALICATFGLLTYLNRETTEPELPEVPPQPGNPLQRVASLQNLDYLARVFGPTLLGDQRQLEMSSAEVTEHRTEAGYHISRLLLDNWQGVNRQLREWSQ
ncbi:hypothetical protein VI817_006699 [Penicillium citrinum]|nr:hypothetical protein VI817_006699 [Penicillium citrinum]